MSTGCGSAAARNRHACDFSLAQDLARFGQAGPKHGSAPIDGITDFLPVSIGVERAIAACVLCKPFSAHEAYYMGLINDVVPGLRIDGRYVPNPLIETARFADDYGRIIFGKSKTGDALKAGQDQLRKGSIDLSLLDEKVEALCTKLLYVFPDCTTKTLEELRKPKLDAWNRNKENSRAWLALNMMTEARAGFRAFNEGTKETGREIDCIGLRRALAANTPWSDELTASILPGAGRT